MIISSKASLRIYNGQGVVLGAMGDVKTSLRVCNSRIAQLHQSQTLAETDSLRSCLKVKSSR